MSFSNSSIAEVGTKNENISINYSFSKPTLSQVEIDNKVYNRILLDNLQYNNDPGKPRLPVKATYISLPLETKVKNVIVTGNKVSLGGSYLIEPCETPMPYSYESTGPIIEPDQEIYNSWNLFPGELYNLIGVEYFRGYSILVIDLYPVQYKPATGKLFYYTNINIEVETEYDGEINQLYRGINKDANAVKQMIDNPVNINNCGEKGTFDEDYDMLIITPDKFKDGFQPLADKHSNSDTDPIKTNIMTVEDIDSLYSGVSLKDKIKNCITEQYENNGIEYVLLGGDEDEVPVYKKIINIYNEIMVTPSDQWYANLDGNNDLMPEIYIGRACAETNEEVSNFVDKTIAYIDSDINEYYKALLVGEDLGFSGVSKWGSNYMDELIDGCDNHYLTEGIPTNKYSLSTLYDRDWISRTWPKREIKNEINNGLYIINHLGHANHDYNLKLRNNDIRGLTNTKYCFIYSQGCFAGAFDTEIMHKFGEEECCAESFTVQTNHGAFAGIWNTRYGIGAFENTDGPSQRFNREFWDAVYSESKDNPNMVRIGVANHDSKVDCIDKVGNDMYNIYKLCYWEITLFGDPTLKIKTPNVDFPEKPEINGPATWVENVECEYSAFSDYINPVHYKFSWGDGTETEWIGSYNNGEKAIASHSWSNSKTYLLRVKTKNNEGYESPWSDGFQVKIKNINTTPPNKPDAPNGVTSGYTYHTYEYKTVASDPDNDQIKYGFDWNEDNVVDEWSEYIDSNVFCTCSHRWIKNGVYNVQVKSCDINGIESNWFSEKTTVTINTDPNNPNPPKNPEISGKSSAKPSEKSSNYSANLENEPDGDPVYCYWDFGDGTTSADFEYKEGGASTDGWLGPYNTPISNVANVNHTWQEKGTYTLKLKCKDEHGAESNETTMNVKVEKGKNKLTNKLISEILEQILSLKILQKYPILFSILQKVSLIIA